MEILITVLFLLCGCLVFFYNRLVKNRNFVNDAWAGIEVQLTKRHDLVPVLVNVVKAYSLHESELYKNVVELRTPTRSPDTNKTEQNEVSLANSLSKLLVLIEDYPELKADQNFRQLYEQLVAIEGDIESARRYYNGSVRDFNIVVESFPSNLVSMVFAFKSAEFFKLRIASIKELPKVDLSTEIS